MWYEDEHRLELKPILRRVYVPEGEIPIAKVNWRYQWLWLYAFVHPRTGETYWWIFLYVNTELFNKVLADFAHQFNLGASKHILLVVDGRGRMAHKFSPQGSTKPVFNVFAFSFTSSLTGGGFPPSSLTGITACQKTMDFGGRANC